MKLFNQLFLNIENTTSPTSKIDLLSAYFKKSLQSDILWAIALFTGKRPKRIIKTSQLKIWATQEAKIPLWLFEETNNIVGDLTETITKIIPKINTKNQPEKTLTEWTNYIQSLSKMDDKRKEKSIKFAWSTLNSSDRFLFNKLITGGFRVSISQKTIVLALAKYLDIEEHIIAYKLLGNWTPDKTTFDQLLLSVDPTAQSSKPYPFYFPHQLNIELEQIRDLKDWYAEYKWDGIRGQLIKRNNNIYLWSREEELITHQFPEFSSLLSIEEDFVIDGEILVYKENKIQNFNALQKRLGKNSPSKKFISEYPAIIMAYDILELNDIDIRQLPQSKRHEKLHNLYHQNKNILEWIFSDILKFKSWDELFNLRKNAKTFNAEGLILKSKKGVYKTGRKKGDWFKWKQDPFTIDAVMLYTQRGRERRSTLFSDFTFAVKNGDKLVPIAKAYTGLTDAEFIEISKFVKQNTIEKFGPVSSIKPELVFEISFEAVFDSPRHKSGVSLHFPKIVRWRKDKMVNDINTLDEVKNFIS